MKKIDKTNACRLLDKANIPYTLHPYDHHSVDVAGDYGVAVAHLLGQSVDETFKTLVGKGASGQVYVLVIPVEATLHLKKAASAVGEKSFTLLAQKDLLPLTGYVRGACSPLGMKKAFPTVFDRQVRTCKRIFISAGKHGLSLSLSPSDVVDFLHATIADLTDTTLPTDTIKE